MARDSGFDPGTDRRHEVDKIEAQVADGMLEELKRQVPCPDEMKPETYTRTLRARAATRAQAARMSSAGHSDVPQ